MPWDKAKIMSEKQLKMKMYELGDTDNDMLCWMFPCWKPGNCSNYK